MKQLTNILLLFSVIFTVSVFTLSLDSVPQWSIGDLVFVLGSMVWLCVPYCALWIFNNWLFNNEHSGGKDVTVLLTTTVVVGIAVYLKIYFAPHDPLTWLALIIYIPSYQIVACFGGLCIGAILYFISRA